MLMVPIYIAAWYNASIMDQFPAAILPPATQSRPSVFLTVKARHLIGWLLASFPLLIVLHFVTNSSLLESVFVYAWVYGVPVLWYFLRAKKKGMQLAGLAGSLPQSKRWLSYPLLNIPVFMLSIGSVIVIYSLIARVAPHAVENLLSRPVSELDAAAQYPLLATLLELFGALILAPVVEEFIFRGFLLHRFTQKWGIAKATVVVSVIFGILHINFFGAAAFSVVLCVIYLYTKSIWPSVLLHFVNNVVSSWPTQESSDGALSPADLQQSYVVGWVFVVIALPVLVWFIKKHWPKKDTVLPYFISKTTLL